MDLQRSIFTGNYSNGGKVKGMKIEIEKRRLSDTLENRP
jgi:hypothetical protein